MVMCGLICLHVLQTTCLLLSCFPNFLLSVFTEIVLLNLTMLLVKSAYNRGGGKSICHGITKQKHETETGALAVPLQREAAAQFIHLQGSCKDGIIHLMKDVYFLSEQLAILKTET